MLFNIGLIAGATYAAVLWVALAYFVVRDARRRTASLSFQLLALVLGFVPPFLGALIYLVVRPPMTLEEERTLALEEEALRDPDAERLLPHPCPSCGRDIETDFVICPYCRTQFARKCPACSRNLRLGWPVCPYCAQEVAVATVARGDR